MNDQQRWAGQQPEWERPHGQPPQGFPPAPGVGGPPPPPPYAPGPVGPTHHRPPGSRRAGGGDRKVVVGVVASILALAAVAAGIWFVTSDDDDDKASQASGSVVASDTPSRGETGAPKASSSPSATAPPTGPVTDPSTADGSPSASGKKTCTPEPGPAKSLTFASAPPMTIDKNASYEMTLETSCGTITVRLDAAKAPTTVNSFAFLAGQDYFDHTPCHRLTTEGIFVLQCGDPTGRGTGGPGYRFADENLDGATYKAGTVAMANSGPDTNGSQFFLVYKDSELPPDYTPFGTITSGMDVLRSIAAEGVWDGSGDGIPQALVTLDDVTVARK